MERILARLERHLGRFAIPNLIQFIVAGMAIVWAMGAVRPGLVTRLTLNMDAVRHGEIWRLATFLFLPAFRDPILVMFDLYFTWWVGSSLDAHWGSFKFNAFYLVGVLGTIAVAMIAGPTSNLWLNTSLLMAFATVFPDVEILFAFVIPIRVKWVGLFTGTLLAYQAFTGDWTTRGAILAAFANYALFFSDHWLGVRKERSLVARQQRRREATASVPPAMDRTCAICGLREADGADIRVCTCEKCGGKPRQLCLPHARNH